VLVIANFLKITEDGPDAIGVVGRIPSVLNFCELRAARIPHARIPTFLGTRSPYHGTSIKGYTVWLLKISLTISKS
jgi:hypothetical protein